MPEEGSSSSVSILPKAPVVFFVLSALILVFSFVLGFFQVKKSSSVDNNTAIKAQIVVSPPVDEEGRKTQVDVSGSVKNPGLYDFEVGARIMDAIERAGGLSKNADIRYFERNINRAELLHDQQKLYIPSTTEVQTGLFSEQRYEENTPSGNNIASTISINTGSKEDIESLPQIGPATAEKILSGRPYVDIFELIDKKVVNKGQFEAIRTLISI